MAKIRKKSEKKREGKGIKTTEERGTRGKRATSKISQLNKKGGGKRKRNKKRKIENKRGYGIRGRVEQGIIVDREYCSNLSDYFIVDCDWFGVVIMEMFI